MIAVPADIALRIGGLRPLNGMRYSSSSGRCAAAAICSAESMAAQELVGAAGAGQRVGLLERRQRHDPHALPG